MNPIEERPVVALSLSSASWIAQFHRNGTNSAIEAVNSALRIE
jgi:hypothetical protein